MRILRHIESDIAGVEFLLNSLSLESFQFISGALGSRDSPTAEDFIEEIRILKKRGFRNTASLGFLNNRTEHSSV